MHAVNAQQEHVLYVELVAVAPRAPLRFVL
jgi:hypothetical protein